MRHNLLHVNDFVAFLVLMKEPILPDRLVEHAEFCRYATILIRLVLGNLSDGITAIEMSLDRVRRAVIVAKTRIQWDQDELLELIWRHLQAKGKCILRYTNYFCSMSRHML